MIALSLGLTGASPSRRMGKRRPRNGKTRARKCSRSTTRISDGKLDQCEREAWRKDREAETMKKYDKNGDGKLDQAEREAPALSAARPPKTPNRRRRSKVCARA